MPRSGWMAHSAAMTGLEVRAKARRMKQQHGLGLLIIDYLQLMRGHGRQDSRERRYPRYPGGSHGRIKALHVPALAFSELNLKSRGAGGQTADAQ